MSLGILPRATEFQAPRQAYAEALNNTDGRLDALAKDSKPALTGRTVIIEHMENGRPRNL